MNYWNVIPHFAVQERSQIQQGVRIFARLDVEQKQYSLTLRHLKSCLIFSHNLDPDHPPADFTGVYRYALVEYGADKPQPILELFREKAIMQAFRQAFEQNDQSIIVKEGEDFLYWNILGDRIRKLEIDIQQEIDIQREFTDFQAVFIKVANSTRTPADVIQSQKIDQFIKN